MTPPTSDEIKVAYEATQREMEDVDLAASMGKLAASDPMLQYQIRMLVMTKMDLSSLVAGSLMYGLHMGIHIGIRRRRIQ
jgi:hypothetical protein